MGLVQHASNFTNSGSSLTVTLGSATTTGNCLIVCITANNTSGGSNPTISSIKIGGSTDNFAQAKTESSPSDVATYIWTDQNIGTSSTTVLITLSGSGMCCLADVYEWSGVKTSSAVDKTNGATGSSTSWSSGSSGTLTQASEVAFGVTGIFSSGTDTITGPSSPWTNETQITASSGGLPLDQLSGYQAVSATTALTYNGTASAGSVFTATCIVTLELASGTTVALSPAVIDVAAQSVGIGNTTALSQAIIDVAAGSVTPSTIFGQQLNPAIIKVAAGALSPSNTTGIGPAVIKAAASTITPSAITPELIVSITPTSGTDPISGLNYPEGVTAYAYISGQIYALQLGSVTVGGQTYAAFFIQNLVSPPYIPAAFLGSSQAAGSSAQIYSGLSTSGSTGSLITLADSTLSGDPNGEVQINGDVTINGTLTITGDITIEGGTITIAGATITETNFNMNPPMGSTSSITTLVSEMQNRGMIS